MQLIGKMKSLWKKMFGRAPSPQTEGRVEKEIPKEAPKKLFKWLGQYQPQDVGFGFISSLSQYLADARGIPARKLVRIHRREATLHYIHRGHIHRPRKSNRADARRGILAKRAKQTAMLQEAGLPEAAAAV